MQFNPSQIRLIVGLGNPGKTYQHTYHNVGALFLEYLAHYLEHVSTAAKKYSLVPPTVSMNESGRAVHEAMRASHSPPSALLVAHDDSDIALGEYKFSYGAGSAGHRGVAHIIKTLGTKNFWRLRIGIRNPQSREKAMTFVLKKIAPRHTKMLHEKFADIANRYFLTKNPRKKSTAGFTLFELLIYISIFIIVITAFIGIFIQVLRIQNRQVATTAVATELQFAMDRIQNLIQDSSSVDNPAGEPSSSLSLDTEAKNPLTDPTTIRLENGVIKIQQGAGSGEEPITSGKVTVDGLTFLKSNVPNEAEGIVSVEIRMSYTEGKTNPQKAFSQTLRSSARPLRD